jgi:glycosyltransferase involved in cell wall biosynthesis
VLPHESELEAEMLVSVIIPTCRRPRLVRRAVESALRQTLRDIEVIVIPADAEEDTHIALSSLADDRLRLLPFAGRLDAAAARNRGVQNAEGAWVAFLDDDDSWLEDKLQLQSQLATRSRHHRPIVSCGSLVRDGRCERLWPRRLPRNGEAIGDYLFRRESLLGATGYLPVSTLFVPRELMLEVPFRDFRPGEDLDWVLRAVRCDGVGVEFVRNVDGDRPVPLTIWNIDVGRPHESLEHQWQNSVSWIRDNRALVSPEAYASFLLTWVSLEAARQRAGIRGFTELWREAMRSGRPSALDLAVHLIHWAIPSSAIRRLSGRITGKALPVEFDAALE